RMQARRNPDATLAERRAQMDAAVFRLADDVQTEPVDAGGVPAEWVTTPESGETAILYLHGGGYTSGSIASHRELASRIARAAASIAGRATSDPTVSSERLQDMVNAYVAGADARHPLASPLFADLAGMPPLLVQVGGREVLYDDAARLVERAKAAGVDAELDED